MSHNTKHGNARHNAVRVNVTFDASLYLRLGNRAKKVGMETGEEWAADFLSSSFLPKNIAPTQKELELRKLQW